MFGLSQSTQNVMQMYMLMLKKDNLDLIASSNGIESSMETYYLNYLNVVTAHAITAISLGPKFLQALIKIFTFFLSKRFQCHRN